MATEHGSKCTPAAARERRHFRGFTLVELMIVVTVVAILASIAYPLYSQQVRKARRTDAKSAVLELAGREERLLSTTNCYSTDQGALGYGAAGSPLTGVAVGSGYFTISVVTTPAAAVCPAQFTVTATATATGGQTNDSDCQSFSVNETGAQSATTAAAADSTATCWR